MIPSTGLIAGTPTLAGQFVAGLSIKEYRNGILLSLTQREFQINVVDCQNTNDRIGSACNDDNPNTENDRIQEDCSCRGVLTAEAKNTKDLFISEYFESTGASQCIELYNPTNQIISSGSYVLKLYSDTFPEGQILHTIGDIPPHETYLVCQEESDTSLINAANGTFDIRFDGNEAIAIEQGTTLVDLFGNRSCFPADFWRGNIGLRSQNSTVVRCPCIQNGVKIDPTACGFPTFSGDWISLPTDDFSRLGKHDTLAPADSFFEDLTDIYCACAETCRERDSLILVDFYNATNGGIWFQTWDLAQPLDTWFGVFLNEEGLSLIHI